MATVYEFNYTGREQSVTLKPGRYKLECWGASSLGINPSNGGYAYGKLILRKETMLYVYVGEAGYNGSLSRYMFNGGGYATYQCGGGATDIRLAGGDWDSEQGLLSRIIVAGGAGGGNNGGGQGRGGGFKGNNGLTNNSSNTYAPGGTQYDGGRGAIVESNGSFGKGGLCINGTSSNGGSGGGGGWYGGAGSLTSSGSGIGGGGGSGYLLTKDSYKPHGYRVTSEYWLEDAGFMEENGTKGTHGKAKITLLNSIPVLDLISYSSTSATLKASHTDKDALTKIEVFIDDTLKETITTDLTLEKTINYTLEDNALHTLKIVVTDNANAIAEKVVSISKNIMPLGDDASLQDIANKVHEMKDGLVNGKTSIINILGLKNIESSLNNTLVELSEKIKVSFDSGDASIENLTNKLTQANNTINQLNSRYKVASGTTATLEAEGSATLFEVDYHGGKSCAYNRWIKVTGLNFIPNIFVTFEKHKTSYPYFRCNFTFACQGVFDKDFAVVSAFSFRGQPGETSYDATGNVIHIDKGTPYMNENGVYLPISAQDDYTTRNWYAIKFK